MAMNGDMVLKADDHLNVFSGVGGHFIGELTNRYQYNNNFIMSICSPNKFCNFWCVNYRFGWHGMKNYSVGCMIIIRVLGWMGNVWMSQVPTKFFVFEQIMGSKLIYEYINRRMLSTNQQKYINSFQWTVGSKSRCESPCDQHSSQLLRNFQIISRFGQAFFPTKPENVPNILSFMQITIIMAVITQIGTIYIH